MKYSRKNRTLYTSYKKLRTIRVQQQKRAAEQRQETEKPTNVFKTEKPTNVFIFKAATQSRTTQSRTTQCNFAEETSYTKVEIQLDRMLDSLQSHLSNLETNMRTQFRTISEEFNRKAQKNTEQAKKDRALLEDKYAMLLHVCNNINLTAEYLEEEAREAELNFVTVIANTSNLEAAISSQGSLISAADRRWADLNRELRREKFGNRHQQRSETEKDRTPQQPPAEESRRTDRVKQRPWKSHMIEARRLITAMGQGSVAPALLTLILMTQAGTRQM